MDIADLKTFESVARLGGMNKAAGELNTVQSNVTARIQGLEGALGVTLFVRHSRGVRPTPAGDRLMPYAKRALDLIDEARRAARDEGTPAGPLTIGSLETTAAARLSPVLAAYMAQYPDVDLTLRTGTTAELIGQVLAREVEGAFVAGPVDHPDLDGQPVFHEELMLATARSIKGPEALKTARGLRIVVLRAGCSYRQRLEDIMARRGAAGLRVLELGTIDAIIGCVAAGLGVTLLPRATVEAAARAGAIRAHPLAPREANVETVFIRRHDDYRSSALTALLESLADAPQREAAE